MKKLFGRGMSLRRRLMVGILVPVTIVVVINAVSLYLQALEAADTAYDRTLLATAKSIGEMLEVSGSGTGARLNSTMLYSALEPFEADNRSRLYYKVTGFNGEMVSGFEDLPAWHGKVPLKGPYAALVDFYDDSYRGDPVRMAVLLQPVAGTDGLGMATIQVAETLELRRTLAQQLLTNTLLRQLGLIAVIALVVVIVVQRATLPVRRLSGELARRPEGELAPITAADAPRELLPLIDATNQVMARLQLLLEHQKRFVRDAAHQLRTPLAVLKTQVQSALRNDIAADDALREINQTVDRATQLANQMLSLAKIEQLRQQGDAPVVDWATIVRAVALDLSALIADHQLDFEIDTRPAPVRSHEWALQELSRNLLHNAIKHSPAGGSLAVRLANDGHTATLTISDSGPGISDDQRQRLFQPFAAGDVRSGSGLGLTICKEIVESLQGMIALENRMRGGRVEGLDASVRLLIAA
ncbi:sensor histidine kinase [Piscinibacter sakaiensis]|uniref:sensor histidine kinase n=1 Tax=Piscinibacter sakaiensis TaxID=1547922 RepID=UPI003AAFBDB2